VLPIATRTAHGLTRCAPTAEDIAQDATVRVLARLDTFNPRWKFSTWVRVITRNLFIDGFRRQRKQSYSPVPDIACEAMPPDQSIAQKQQAAKVRSAVANLPDLYREVIELHHFKQLKYREIAEQLDIPIGTVMNRIHRARKKMKDDLTPMAA